MGREVRRVPAGWEHPKDEGGNHVPLYGGSFDEADAAWTEGWQRWQKGEVKDWSKDGAWKPKPSSATGTYTEWAGGRPNPDEYMPQWAPGLATHFMMYETCSEGTPISPAFATPEELAQWLADNEASAFGDQTASYESWLRVARGGWAPSAVMNPGEGIVSGVEGIRD